MRNGGREKTSEGHVMRGGNCYMKGGEEVYEL